MRYILVLLAVVVLIAASFGVGRLSAGSPDAPGGPTAAAAQMHTLEQIYQRIVYGGAASAVMATFTEPSTGPGAGTMHTLEDIYNRIGTSAHVPRVTANLCPCGPGDRDDSRLRKGALWPSPRFADNANGTVTDNLTGLVWLKNANCFGGRAWLQALADANVLANGQCSLTDGSTAGTWRLPNVRELLSLIDYSVYAPAVPTGHPFTNVPVLPANTRYWSSNVVENNQLNAWNIDFDIGTVNRNQPMTSLYYVWPVKGGQ